MNFYLILFGLGFLACTTSVNGIPISKKMLDLLNSIPWAQNTSSPEVKACKTTKCDEYFMTLCQNGGKCVVTENCQYKCTCPRGYGGIFCGMKTTDDVTTFSVEITTSLQNVPSTTYADIKTSSTEQSKPSSLSIQSTGDELTTQRNKPT